MAKDFALSAIPDSELQKLDNQLCFSLYVCSKEVIKKYKPLLDPLGLTYTGYITLLALWEEDNINVKDLGKRLYLDSGTLTPVLKKLEKLGYIERTRNREDERNLIIKLTPLGRSLKKEAVCVPKDLLKSVDYSSVKAVVLLKTLHQLMDVLTEDE